MVMVMAGAGAERYLRGTGLATDAQRAGLYGIDSSTASIDVTFALL